MPSLLDQLISTDRSSVEATQTYRILKVNIVMPRGHSNSQAKHRSLSQRESDSMRTPKRSSKKWKIRRAMPELQLTKCKRSTLSPRWAKSQWQRLSCPSSSLKERKKLKSKFPKECPTCLEDPDSKEVSAIGWQRKLKNWNRRVTLELKRQKMLRYRLDQVNKCQSTRKLSR